MPDKPKKVLLFDDDFESMSPLKFYLETALTLQVALTANREVIERLASERFDLICIDLMIHPISLDARGEPVDNVHFEGVNWQKTGLEFLKRLRRGEFSNEAGVGTSPMVPIIVLSAVADDSVTEDLKDDIVVQNYVEKPFALEALVKCIQKLIQE